MLKLPSMHDLDHAGPRIFLYRQPADMRQGFDRLAELVRSHLGEDPLSGALFLFRSRSGDRLKILYWDRDGYALWYKRLEMGVFRFPRPTADAPCKLSLRPSELAMLLEGIDLRSVRRLARYKRPDAMVVPSS
jgi:transposase